MSTLAERVKEAIEDSEASVQSIADACGISVQAVYKWMSGGSMTISGENLVEIARLTGYEARWIIKNMGEKKKDKKCRIVSNAMEKMPEFKKDMMVEASNSLAEQAEQAEQRKNQ